MDDLARTESQVLRLGRVLVTLPADDPRLALVASLYRTWAGRLFRLRERLDHPTAAR